MAYVNFTGLVRRVTRAAEAVPLPSRRRRRARKGGAATPVGPVLVAGRGLRRRRPRSPLSSLLWGTVYLLLGAGITLFVTRFLLS